MSYNTFRRWSVGIGVVLSLLIVTWAVLCMAGCAYNNTPITVVVPSGFHQAIVINQEGNVSTTSKVTTVQANQNNVAVKDMVQVATPTSGITINQCNNKSMVRFPVTVDFSDNQVAYLGAGAAAGGALGSMTGVGTGPGIALGAGAGLLAQPVIDLFKVTSTGAAK